MKLSIGVRLTLWYLAIFALGQFAFGAGMWLVLRHHLISLVDDNLRDQSEDVRNVLMSQRKNANLDKFREEVAESYDQEHAGEYLAISTDAGDLVFMSTFLQKNAFAAPSGIVDAPEAIGRPFENKFIGGRPVRFLHSSVSTHGMTFLIVTGASTKDVWATLHAFRNYLLLLAPLMLLISAGGGYWISQRALSPVDALTHAARNISGRNLSCRLEKLDTGDELQRLCDTLNEMLDRIEKSFQQVTQFTADASHELRTPVALMRTEAELALRRERDPGAYREALQQILKETERTSIMIEDLLALARADSGREFLKPTAIELGDLLRDCIKRCEPLATRAGHELKSDLGNIGEVWLMADEQALRRVFSILIDNAIKYTPAPGRIDVCLRQHDQRAIVSVEDTGIGISVAEQSRIFERFYRVDKARTRAAGGAGLGLAIARWIIERHDGTISVKSTADQGSRFSVEIPITSHRELATPDAVDVHSITQL